MKTVKARIAAIVTADGKWAAQGCHSSPDEDADWSWLNEMCDYEKPTINPQRVWITVELPIPEVSEVVGKIEQ